MSKKGSTYVQVAFIVFGAVLTLTSSYIFWCGQQDIDRKYLAEALYNEIDMLEDTVVPLAVGMENSPSSLKGDQIPQIIYPENGLYYTARKDISAYDDALATNISAFYNNLILAENDRKVLMEIYMGINKNTPAEKKVELEDASGQISQRMRSSLITSAEMIPSIKKDLAEYLDIEQESEPVYLS